MSAPRTAPATTAPPIQRVPLAALRAAPWNPRTIKDARFQQLCRSLEADPDFLYQRPILATLDGTVFAGNMRVRAAQHLGWPDVPAMRCDIPEQLAKERALRDNNAYGDWQEDELAALLHQLEQQGTGLDTLGFEDKELRQLLARLAGEGEPAVDPGPQLERAQELREKWQTAPGQLWVIDSQSQPGQCHRLLCGDSTSEPDVSRLMHGERAVLFASDPPYAISYDGTNHPTKASRRARTPQEDPTNKDWSKSYKDWDKFGDGEGEALYDGFIAVAKAVAITEDAAWYCWHASRNQAMVERVWERHGAFVHQQIVWTKPRGILTRSWYLWAHEPCFMGWVRGKKPKRVSDDYPTTVWALPGTLPGQATDHPTVKPTECFAIPMRQHTEPGDLCYEPFSGSGTQIVVAEQLGRVCYALEIAPEFVAVALERLAGMGLVPRLEPG